MSLHWMDPDMTTREIIRLLRPGGVFAAYSYRWHIGPPDVQRAYDELSRRIEKLGGQNQVSGELKRWPKRQQEETLEASGAFRLTRSVGLHSEYYVADELVEFSKTFGVARNVVKRGLGDEESRLAAFCAERPDRIHRRKATCLPELERVIRGCATSVDLRIEFRHLANFHTHMEGAVAST